MHQPEPHQMFFARKNILRKRAPSYATIIRGISGFFLTSSLVNNGNSIHNAILVVIIFSKINRRLIVGGNN
jgi:hypothetical protein